MEGPMDFVREGDEYLQPKLQDDNLPTNSQLSIAASNDPQNKPCSSRSWQNAPTSISESIPLENISGRHPNHWDNELLRYAQMTGFDINDFRQYCNGGMVHSDSSDSKYHSDPSKVTEKDDISSEDAVSKLKEAQVANIKLDLLLDEDDYLMPSTANPSAYMDLIESGNQDPSQPNSSFQKYPEFLPVIKKAIDNPEYLLTCPEEAISIMIENNIIPKSPDAVDHNSCASTPTLQNPNGGAPVTFVAQRSIEEESISDHEYYNDLQRELQPLRRNETKV